MSKVLGRETSLGTVSTLKLTINTKVLEPGIVGGVFGLVGIIHYVKRSDLHILLNGQSADRYRPRSRSCSNVETLCRVHLTGASRHTILAKSGKGKAEDKDMDKNG